MGASKILGILGICFGWFIPLFGIVFGIIGLSIKKEAGEESRDKILNIISIAEGVLFGMLWSLMFSYAGLGVQ